MAVSPGFRTLVVDQLSRVLPQVRTRTMFGGVGVYAGDLFFALIHGDALYLKVDDTNRPDFEALGMGPFRPGGEGGEVMQYYHLPEDVLEDAEALQPWVDKAVAVAASKKKTKKKRT